MIRIRRAAAGLGLALFLSACGGGGDEAAPPPQTTLTVAPASLDISATEDTAHPITVVAQVGNPAIFSGTVHVRIVDSQSLLSGVPLLTPTGPGTYSVA